MKYAILFAAVFLTACVDERPSAQSESGLRYYVECIGGIEYWTSVVGQTGFMAVRVDPETLTFVRCNGD